MKQFSFAVLIMLLLVCEANAQFTKGYAPAKWTTTNSAGSAGTVNSSGAPASVTVNGSDAGSGSNCDVTFAIPSVAGGVWSFSWSYHTNDDAPSFDPAFVIIGGVATQLTNNSGAVNQSGTYSGSSVASGTSVGFRVRATDNFGGNATITITSFSPPGGILPIKLLSFTATESSKEVKLDWQTAVEVNNDRFEVERSADGSAFSKITTVKGAGNTALLQKYTAYDKAPLAGTGYYRLKQVDFDGNYTYSHVSTVKAVARNSSVGIYPNPAQDNVNLQWQALSAHNGEVMLYNTAGRLLQTRTLPFRAGANNITWNVSGLPSGVYYFKIEDATMPFVVKH